MSYHVGAMTNPASTIRSTTPAALSATDLSLFPPGLFADATTTYQGRWDYRIDSLIAPDGKTVVAATGQPGNWHREPNGTPGANLEPSWYINTATGDDTASGVVVSAPLASVAEVMRRIGRQPIMQNVTVTMVGSDAGALAIDIYIETGVTFTIQGTRTVILSDVIASHTAWSPSTAVVGDATFTTTTGSLAAYVGVSMVQLHSTPTQISPVVKDLATGKFMALFCNTAAAGAQVDPGNVACDVYTINGFAGNVTVHVRGGGYMQFIDMNLASAGTNHTRVSLGGAIFQGCLVHGLIVTRGVHDVQVIGGEVFDAVVMGRAQSFAAVWAFGAATALTIQGNSGLVQVQTISMSFGGTLNIGSGTDGTGVMQTNAGFAVADAAVAVGVQVWPGSMLRCGDYFFLRKAVAVTVGFIVMNGARIHYTGGKLIAAGGTVPTGFATVVGTAKASGALPYVEAVVGLASIIVDA